MSILIRGAEMPKNCKHCKFRKTELQEDPDWCLISGESLFYLAENDCPLIEAPEWIPVAERWPEQFKPVLVYYNRNGYSGMGVAEYYHDGDTKVWRGFGGFIPTHWMPLPEPPEDGET